MLRHGMEEEFSLEDSPFSSTEQDDYLPEKKTSKKHNMHLWDHDHLKAIPSMVSVPRKVMPLSIKKAPYKKYLILAKFTRRSWPTSSQASSPSQ